MKYLLSSKLLFNLLDLEANFEIENSDRDSDSDEKDANEARKENKFDQEAFDLFLACIKASEKLRRIRLNHAKLTSSQTCQVIKAVLDS